MIRYRAAGIVLALVLPAALSIGGTAALAATPDATVSVTGTVEVLASDPAPGTDQQPTTTVLLRSKGHEYRLPASLAGTLRAGEAVRVAGSLRGSTFQSTSVSSVQADGIPPSTGTQSVYVIRAQWSGADATTTTQVKTAFASLGQWFKQVSFGAIPGTATAIAPSWVHIAKPDGCDFDSIYYNAVAAEQTATKGAFKPDAYQHVVVYMPLDPDCDWGGLGDIGGPRVWLNGRTDYFSALDLWATAHEFGHNFGLYHSHSQECYAGGVDVTSSATCFDPVEYGDPADVMGDSNQYSDPAGGYLAAEYNAPQKQALGWLGTNLKRLNQCGATTELSPYEVKTSTNVLAAAIAAPPRTSGLISTYWLEWRNPVVGSPDENLETGLVDGALLHRTGSDELPDAGPDLLDGVPSTAGDFNDAAVPYGTSVTTAEGLIVSVGTAANGLLPVSVSSIFPATVNWPTFTTGSGSVTLHWQAPNCAGRSPLTGYKVQISSDNGAHWTNLALSIPPDATSHTITGLTNGHGYLFRVAATNAAGTGQMSHQTGIATPHLNVMALSMTPTTNATLRYGSSMTLGTQLTNTTLAVHPAGVTVYLYAATSPSGPFTQVATRITSATGTASVPIKPATNRYFQWRYPATTTTVAAASAVRTVLVAQTVTATQSATKVKSGGTLTIWGVVSPSGAGQYVYLQSYYSGAWHTATNSAKIVSQKMPNGVTEIGYLLSFATTHTAYRIYRPATYSNAAGYSAVETVALT